MRNQITTIQDEGSVEAVGLYKEPKNKILKYQFGDLNMRFGRVSRFAFFFHLV